MIKYSQMTSTQSASSESSSTTPSTNSTSIDISSLNTLRTSIVNFHQNIRIVYEKLRMATPGTIPSVLFEAYKPYLDNLAASPVFGAQFTTAQMNQHLRYLSGITKKLASMNPMLDSKIINKYKTQPYYENVKYFCKKIMELFVPLATGIKYTLPDDQLITQSSAMSDLLNKVGANFNTKIHSYINNITPTNTLGKVIAENIIKIRKESEYYELEVFLCK